MGLPPNVASVNRHSETEFIQVGRSIGEIAMGSEFHSPPDTSIRGAWGGVLGGIVGVTGWLAVLTAVSMWHQEWLVGWVSLAVLLALAFTSALLWRWRSHLSPYRAMLILMAAMSVLYPIVFLLLTFCSSAEIRTKLAWPPAPIWHVVVYLVSPLGLLQAWWLERRSSRLLGSS